MKSVRLIEAFEKEYPGANWGLCHHIIDDLNLDTESLISGLKALDIALEHIARIVEALQHESIEDDRIVKMADTYAFQSEIAGEEFRANPNLKAMNREALLADITANRKEFKATRELLYKLLEIDESDRCVQRVGLAPMLMDVELPPMIAQGIRELNTMVLDKINEALSQVSDDHPYITLCPFYRDSVTGHIIRHPDVKLVNPRYTGEYGLRPAKESGHLDGE